MVHSGVTPLVNSLWNLSESQKHKRSEQRLSTCTCMIITLQTRKTNSLVVCSEQSLSFCFSLSTNGHLEDTSSLHAVVRQTSARQIPETHQNTDKLPSWKRERRHELTLHKYSVCHSVRLTCVTYVSWEREPRNFFFFFFFFHN